MRKHDSHIVWRSRLRLVALMLVLVMGLAVAAFESRRQEEAYRPWGVVYNTLAKLCDPVRDKMLKVVMIGRRLGNIWDIEEENEQLRRELTRLSVEHQLTVEELGRLTRLATFASWQIPLDLSLLPADVTGVITDGDGFLMIINRGRDAGLRTGDSVVAQSGLVGLVRRVMDRSAIVQILSDPISATGALVRESRVRGIVHGAGRGRALRFNPENEGQQIETGNLIMTSGFENSLFPKGLVIGEVVSIELNTSGLPYARVEPTINYSKLDEVMIVLPRTRPAAEDTPSTFGLGMYRILMPLTPIAPQGSDAPTTPGLATPLAFPLTADGVTTPALGSRSTSDSVTLTGDAPTTAALTGQDATETDNAQDNAQDNAETGEAAE